MKKYYNYQIKKVFSVSDLKTIEQFELKKGASFPKESHDFHEFVFVNEGVITCTLNDKEEHLQQNDFLLILPNTKHEYYFNEKSDIYIICFKCKSDILEIIAKTIKLNAYQCSLVNRIFFEAENSFEFPFDTKIVLKENAVFGAQQLVENLIEELLIQILRGNLADLKPVKDSDELQNNIIQDIIGILKDNIYGNLTLTEICRKVYYSSTFLNDLFKKKKNSTIMKYYTVLKLDEAKNLLKSGMSTSEIAEKLCFEDANYFSKVFKKYTGITPFQFKKNN